MEEPPPLIYVPWDMTSCPETLCPVAPLLSSDAMEGMIGPHKAASTFEFDQGFGKQVTTAQLASSVFVYRT